MGCRKVRACVRGCVRAYARACVCLLAYVKSWGGGGGGGADSLKIRLIRQSP